MHTTPSSKRPYVVAKVVGSLLAATAVAVLFGWVRDIGPLKSVLPGLPKMAPLTALLFLLAGVALWSAAEAACERNDSHANRPKGRGTEGIALGCAAMVWLAAGFRLAEYLLGRDVGFDQLGFGTGANSAPGHMAPATAASFLFLSSALLLARTAPIALQSMALLGGLAGWLGFSHYLFGGQPLLPYAQMAPHTALSFLLLTAGILCTRPEVGLVALLGSDSAGGTMARRLVPAAVFLPVALGWLRLQGQRAGWYGTEAGIALLALANVIVFGGLIWSNSALLHQRDTRRKRAEERVHAQLDRMNLLNEVTRAIGERQDLSSIYQSVLRNLEQGMDFDFGCICDYEAGAQRLTVRHVGTRSVPLAMELALTEEAHIPIDMNGLSRCVAGELVYEPDIAGVPMPFPKRLASGGLRSLVIAPLLVENRVFGVFVASRRRANGFSSGDCEVLRQLCEHVGLAAHHAQLYDSLQQAYDDLRQTQDAVMQQERLRALGQMASGVAHDINNALSPVAMYAELLLTTEPNLSERTRKSLEVIQRSVDDAARTVARMREFYRHREPQLALAPVDINGLVRQVVEITRARWADMPQRHGIIIEMKTELASEAPPIMGVESEIREALVNLIFNAVDAMPSGGTVTLRTRVTGGGAVASQATSDYSVEVEVCDTGSGMDERTKKRCTEPFFTTKGERGTGLGLAMVHGTVQRHSAELEIESEVGKGTTVRVTFAAQCEAIPGVAQPDDVPGLRGRTRILVIDDDPLILKALRETLEGDGHIVSTANGGQAGIDLFVAAQKGKEPFAVVITDLGMPQIDGRKVAHAIKEASPAAAVILLTGWGQRLVAEGDVPADVDHVLGKPPKLRELRATLALCAQRGGAAKSDESTGGQRLAASR